jgi:hypothetical protein
MNVLSWHSLVQTDKTYETLQAAQWYTMEHTLPLQSLQSEFCIHTDIHKFPQVMGFVQSRKSTTGL